MLIIQIVQLQHKKLAMTEAALSTDPDAALGKLTVEDVSPISLLSSRC
jgi:DNA repair protein RAD16